MIARARCLALCAVLGLTGCSARDATDPGDTSSRAEPVVNGELSGDDQNSAVLIWNNRRSTWCTGAIVAPTLVLTARHCLFRYQAGPNNIVKCNEKGDVSPVYDAYDPTDFTVSIGSQRGPDLRVEATGVEMYSSEIPDLCLNDVALLEVDTPLSQPSLPMRLDDPPEKGELGLLVGWGATEADAEAENPRLTPHRRQRELEVLEVGERYFTPPNGTSRFIERATFIATEGGCQGDSGGPVISKATGAIFGVMHAMQTPDPTQGLESDVEIADCLGGFTVLHRIDVQQDWIRAAFRKVGAAPWSEGRPLPRELRQSCELGDDCVSGLCIHAGDSAFCSVRCDDTACPSGMQCVGPELDRVCSLPNVDSAESSSSGCALSASSSVNSNRKSGATALAVAWLVALFARGRRRNRALPALRDSV